MTYNTTNAARYAWVPTQSDAKGQTTVLTLTIAPDPQKPKTPTR